MKNDGDEFRAVRISDSLEECVIGAMLCVNCWPKEKKYAHFMWFGLGLCKECFEPRRRQVDEMGPHEILPGIDRRTGGDYITAWGEEPPKD